MRFWISWEEPVEEDLDCRPLRIPIPREIIGLWCTGYGENFANICAVVDIDDADLNVVKYRIRKSWNPIKWRFCHIKPDNWEPNSDRFPKVSRWDIRNGYTEENN